MGLLFTGFTFRLYCYLNFFRDEESKYKETWLLSPFKTVGQSEGEKEYSVWCLGNKESVFYLFPQSILSYFFTIINVPSIKLEKKGGKCLVLYIRQWSLTL